MSLMADPIIILKSLQQALNDGMPLEQSEIEADYKFFYDEPNGGRRFSFAKIINREAQSLAIFGLENPLNGLICYNVGYAVNERHRGHGLALEAVNFGLERLKTTLKSEGVSQFYLEAIIDKNNLHSINITNKLFLSPGVPTIDGESGTPSLHFKRLIN